MDINFSVSPTYVKAGKCQDLELFISNCTNDDIPFYNEQQIEACKYPAPEAGNEEAKCPDGFYLYFLYGTGGANMVSVADAAIIEVSLKQGKAEEWSIAKGTSVSKVGTYWVVAPKENVVFKRSDELIISIKNIKVDDSYGKATLCLIFRQNKIKKETPIGILKYYPPVINKFYITPSLYKAGSKVTLSWELEHAENCSIWVDDKKQEQGTCSLTVSSTEEWHHIKVTDDKCNDDSKSITLPVIDSFAEAAQENSQFLTMEEVENELTESFIQVPYAAPGPPDPPSPPPPVVYKDVRVSWKTHNTTKCTIDSSGSTEYPKEGTATVKIREDQMQLKLYAHGENDNIVYQEINLKQ